MSAFAERTRALLGQLTDRAESLSAVVGGWAAELSPSLLFPLVGALIGVAAALLVYGLVFGGLSLRRGRSARAARVAALSARGVSRAEIARLTGVSQDAVTMLLQTRAEAAGRRILPLAARISGGEHRDRPSAPRGRVRQSVAVKEDGFFSSSSPAAAYRLLDVAARSTRVSPDPRAA